MRDDTRDGGKSGGGMVEPGGRRRARELTPTQRALGLLTRREHSRRELTRKLLAKGIASDDVEAVVAKLAGAGWQDDVRFAESLVRWRVSAGYGPIHIRAELATHGLDRETIAAVLETCQVDWTENARDLVRRRYGEGGGGDLKLRRKAADLLMRRGFDATSIRTATRFDPGD